MDIMNCSFSSGSKSNLEKLAMKNYDGLIVCSAGNYTSDNDDKPMYPASYDLDNIISVAATDSNDKLAVFSNFGENTVDLAAPGVGIYTIGNSDSKNEWYVLVDGTSVSAPYVTGVAALIKSKYPTMAAESIKKLF